MLNLRVPNHEHKNPQHSQEYVTHMMTSILNKKSDPGQISTDLLRLCYIKFVEEVWRKSVKVCSNYLIKCIYSENFIHIWKFWVCCMLLTLLLICFCIIVEVQIDYIYLSHCLCFSVIKNRWKSELQFWFPINLSFRLFSLHITLKKPNKWGINWI